MSQNIEKLLADVFRGDILADQETLDRFSRDASMFEVRPTMVAAPRDSADVQSLVRFAAEHKVPITPRSGGSDMSGGVLTDSIVIDCTRYLNRLKKIGNDYAVVEPGMYYRDFEEETLDEGLIFPSYPASRELCAIGGIIGNNAGGEKTLIYGKTEDYIRELKVVLADGNEYTFHALGKNDLEEKLALPTFEGEVYRNIHKLLDDNYGLVAAAKPSVSKNSAGYYLWNVWDKKTGIFDLTKLFVGSQGTLGIVTEVTLKLVRPKPATKLLVIFLRDIGELSEVVNAVRPLNPESLESYDDKTLRLVFSYFADFAKSLGTRNLFKLALDFLPEARIVLTGGLPKLVLLAEFTGEDDESVARRAQRARDAVKEFRVQTHIVKDENEARKYWTIRREAFNLLRSHLKKRRSVPFIDDVIVRPEQLPEFLPKLYAILADYKDQMTYAIGGHVGDGNLHIYSILDIADPSVRAVIPTVADRVYELVISMGGSITAEHNDGLIRTPYLRAMYGDDMYKLFERVKQIFDPSGIFNPGKKVGGSREYAMRHIRTS